MGTRRRCVGALGFVVFGLVAGSGPWAAANTTQSTLTTSSASGSSTVLSSTPPTFDPSLVMPSVAQAIDGLIRRAGLVDGLIGVGTNGSEIVVTYARDVTDAERAQLESLATVATGGTVRLRIVVGAPYATRSPPSPRPRQPRLPPPPRSPASHPSSRRAFPTTAVATVLLRRRSTLRPAPAHCRTHPAATASSLSA